MDRPRDRAVEDVRAVTVHSEHEARVDHHPALVQPPHHRAVVPADVLAFALPGQILRVDGLEADEEAAQPGVHGPLQQAGRQHRVDRAGRLPDPAGAAQAGEEGLGEAPVAEQVVVQEVPGLTDA